MPTSTGKRNMYIYDLNDGEYIRLRGVDFGKGAKQFSITAAASPSATVSPSVATQSQPTGQAGCTITLRLDGLKGPVIGIVTLKDTKSLEQYKAFTAKVKDAVGVHDLYLCFGNVNGDVRLDWWQFKP